MPLLPPADASLQPPDPPILFSNCLQCLATLSFRQIPSLSFHMPAPVLLTKNAGRQEHPVCLVSVQPVPPLLKTGTPFHHKCILFPVAHSILSWGRLALSPSANEPPSLPRRPGLFLISHACITSHPSANCTNHPSRQLAVDLPDEVIPPLLSLPPVPSTPTPHNQLGFMTVLHAPDRPLATDKRGPRMHRL